VKAHARKIEEQQSIHADRLESVERSVAHIEEEQISLAGSFIDLQTRLEGFEGSTQAKIKEVYILLKRWFEGQ
jgi:hypothetical protein